MKRLFLLFLPFLLFVAGTFVACEEVEEAGKYDNWRPRNEAFVDSIKGKAGDRLVLTAKDADEMEEGELFAIQVPTTSTNMIPQYAYCKKLVKKETGERPNFDGYNSTVKALQYMRVGERWMLYIPWQSAYGSSGNSSGTIPGYTSLTFDVYLEGFVE